MIELSKAYDIVISSARPTGVEIVPFGESLNRILAEDISSDFDMPRFNKSSVDGYACRREDLQNDLELIEIIPAGTTPMQRVTALKCSKIMTGAPVPEGADMVFMVEDSIVLESGKIRCTVSFRKDNISKRGEDVKTGDVVLRAGKMIRPQDIAVMATVGHSSVSVRKMPVVAVISSGSELVEPDSNPGESQIRNSNAYQLLAQISRAQGKGIYYGISPDNEDSTYNIISKAIKECDMVIITGGVSMGDFDFIPSVLERLGVNIIFSRIAVQPGKPTTFGTHPDSLVFGLPGNPVSSFIQFELLIRPLIYRMMGFIWKPVEVILPMKERYTRKSTDRLAFIPVVILDGLVIPVEYHGSGHISALPDADGIISIQSGIQKIEKGEQVSVRQI